MIEVNDQNFAQEILQHDKPALVDFWAPWCGPCRMVGPIMDQLAEQFGAQVKVTKLNVDESPETPGHYNVRGIPTVILFKGGQEVDKIVGAAPKAKFEEMIKRHL
jgi:thioredoxin 1